MTEELRAICVNAVSVCEDLPPDARENKNAVGAVEIRTFDQSYIEFLDSQIALESRGHEWSNRLKIRRDSLAKYAGRELASCRLTFGSNDYWIRVDPLESSVVHWEAYEENE